MKKLLFENGFFCDSVYLILFFNIFENFLFIDIYEII